MLKFFKSPSQDTFGRLKELCSLSKDSFNASKIYNPDHGYVSENDLENFFFLYTKAWEEYQSPETSGKKPITFFEDTSSPNTLSSLVISLPPGENTTSFINQVVELLYQNTNIPKEPVHAVITRDLLLSTTIHFPYLIFDRRDKINILHSISTQGASVTFNQKREMFNPSTEEIIHEDYFSGDISVETMVKDIDLGDLAGYIWKKNVEKTFSATITLSTTFKPVINKAHLYVWNNKKESISGELFQFQLRNLESILLFEREIASLGGDKAEVTHLDDKLLAIAALRA